MRPDASRIILVFVDGLGVGSADPKVNPFARGRYPAIEQMIGGRSLNRDAPDIIADHSVYRPIDANLGMEGLPQSGTGQATLFTGVNCAEVAGRHYGPFPHSSSRPVIRESNLFLEAGRIAGTPAVFANAYPDRFFRYIERTKRWTVTTLCCVSAGIPLRTGSDLRNGVAVSADITGKRWPESESDHAIITPEEAGMRLAMLSNDAPLTVFEYFETDKAGHEMNLDRADRALVHLDGLLAGILKALGPTQTLVVTSDHGNIEDLTVKTHTRNRVPLIAWGSGAKHFHDADGLESVKPAILASIRS